MAIGKVGSINHLEYCSFKIKRFAVVSLKVESTENYHSEILDLIL